jgi:drug/metabolite transporter (DMT)-like permease
MCLVCGSGGRDRIEQCRAALSIQSCAQSVLPSPHIALLLTMEPVFAWITSFLVMGERLGLCPASGPLLILAGIALTELVLQPHVPTAHEASERQGLGIRP